MFCGAFRAFSFLYVAKGTLTLSKLVAGINQASGLRPTAATVCVCVCAEYDMKT